MNVRTLSPEQLATEAHIARQIEARDVNVLLDYATFVEQELDGEPIRNLLLGILTTDDRIWRFALAEVATHSRSLSAAMKDLGAHLEQQRSAFLEHAAKALLAEAQGEQA